MRRLIICRIIINPIEYPHTLYFCGSIFIHFFSGGLRKMIFSATVRFGHSRSHKVIDFGNNRKRTCDFLLVRHIVNLVLSSMVS